MLSFVTENMGLLCSKNRRYNDADTEENAQVCYINKLHSFLVLNNLKVSMAFNLINVTCICRLQKLKEE